MRRLTPAIALTALLVTAPVLTGCAGDAQTTDAAQHAAGAEVSTDQAVTIDDGFAKAGEQGGMTGVFGSIANHGTEDLVITGVQSDAAEMVELHEVVGGTMQEKQAETVVPAGGSLELAPGADHIMLMGLTRELLPGDEVSVTLVFGNGSSADLTVLVKDYSGALEEYVESDDAADHDQTSDHDGEH